MPQFELPDGEYEIEISDFLQQHLVNVHSNNVTNLRNQKNDELLSIKYGKYPEDIDHLKALELEKEDKKLGSFKLKASSTDDGSALVFEGQAAESRDIDCILIYNETTHKLELQRLGYLLRTTSLKKESTNEQDSQSTNQNTQSQSSQTSQQPLGSPEKKIEAPKKKKKASQPSVFQPKQQRSKTPTIPPTSSNNNFKRSSSVPLLDDDTPLTQLGKNPIKPQASSSSKVSVPSPLGPSNTQASQESPDRPKKSQTSLAKTVVNANSKQSASTPKLATTSTPTPSPYTEPETSYGSPHSNSKNTPYSHVSSKKPPSTMSTPQLAEKAEPSDDDDGFGDFGDLADELEEQLNEGDSGFITVDNRDDPKTPTYNDYQSKPTKSPTNFRNLAGLNSSNDDDDLSSSSEEE